MRGRDQETEQYIFQMAIIGLRLAALICPNEHVSPKKTIHNEIAIRFAHLKKILRFERLRLRGPTGAQDECLLAATVQNLRKLAKLVPLPPPEVAIVA